MGAVQVKKRQSARGAPKVKDALTQALRLSSQIFAALWQRDLLITMALVALLLASAFGVTWSSYLSRALFSELNEQHLQRDAFQRQWSQLLLEQSALSAHGHVEHQAVSQLNMKVPERDDIVVVQIHRQH